MTARRPAPSPTTKISPLTTAVKEPAKPRSVWPRVLQLSFCPLTDASRQKLAATVWDKYFKGKSYSPAIPVALRWAGHPFYGFPRSPFRLYRRRRYQDDPFRFGKALLAAPLAISQPQVVGWGGVPMYDVVFEVKLAAGQSLTVWACDDRDQLIPEQFVTLTQSGWGRIRISGIGSLQVSGQGSLEKIIGISLYDMANLPDWGEPIQGVGMPFTQGETALPIYSDALQGETPVSLVGYEAARRRLAIASELHLPCPPIPGAVVSPSWPAPDPDAFLKAFVTGTGGDAFFQDIKKCLEATDDVQQLQRDFRVSRTLDGIRQLGYPASPDRTARFELPVVGVSLLNAATDSYAALALGYGTTDFPPQTTIASGSTTGGLPTSFVTPAGSEGYAYPYDYAIVEKLKIAQSLFPKSDPWVFEVEIAAIADLYPLPLAPKNLTAELLTRDRPSKRDQPCAETRRLHWSLTPFPQAFGIAVARPNAQPIFLNTRRLGGKGYQPYIPNRPAIVEGQVTADQLTTFLDRQGNQPFSGSASSLYSVIGTDVFGRWSNWKQVNFTSQAAPVQQPGISQLNFEPTALQGSKQIGNLAIDFAWDWSDRSPGTIRFYSRLFALNTVPSASPPAAFEIPSNKPLPAIALDVTFNPNTEQPAIANISRFPGKIETLPANPNSGVRSYRLVVQGVSFDFANGATKIGYAACARATEKVRPNEWSVATAPKSLYVADPRPPQLSFTPPEVLWTSLPDVTGKARAKLEWTASSNTIRSAVWYATETQLIAHRGSPFPPELTLEQRAIAWKTYLQDYEASHGAINLFTRLAEVAYPQTHLQIELSQASDILHFYRISVVGPNAVESAKSSQIFKVAVPQRFQPGPPQLLLRSESSEGQPAIKIVAIAGAAPETFGYRVYRVRQSFLATDLGLMGQPAYDLGYPHWQADAIRPTLGEPEIPCHSLLDPQPPSWFPYYYRLQAAGQHAPDYGKYRGYSLPSPPQEIYLKPAQPPAIALLHTYANVPQEGNFLQASLMQGSSSQKTARFSVQSVLPPTEDEPPTLPTVNIYAFTCDLPWRLSPLGVASFEIWELRAEGAGFTRHLVERVLSHEVTRLTPPPPVEGDNNGYESLASYYTQKLLYYRSPNSSFAPQYRLILPIINDGNPNGTLPDRLLRLTDPLGRTREIELPRSFSNEVYI